MSARTKTPSQAEMKTRIARFKDLISTKARHAQGKGIPQVWKVLRHGGADEQHRTDGKDYALQPALPAV